MTKPLTFVRRTQAAKQLGVSVPKLLRDARRGLFPPPVKLGGRGKTAASAWLQDELDAMARGYLAGFSQDELRALVAGLLVKRQERAKEIG